MAKLVSKMVELKLQRRKPLPEYEAQGTTGSIVLPDGSTVETGELPDRNNHASLSRVKADKYLVKKVFSPKHGRDMYRLEDKNGRTAIEIHNANYFGDVTKGCVSQVLGCIALGEEIGNLNGQVATLHSVKALAHFEEVMKGEPFTLEILDPAEV